MGKPIRELLLHPPNEIRNHSAGGIGVDAGSRPVKRFENRVKFLGRLVFATMVVIGSASDEGVFQQAAERIMIGAAMLGWNSRSEAALLDGLSENGIPVLWLFRGAASK